jgi:hypothetical protein
MTDKKKETAMLAFVWKKLLTISNVFEENGWTDLTDFADNEDFFYAYR